MPHGYPPWRKLTSGKRAVIRGGIARTAAR